MIHVTGKVKEAKGNKIKYYTVADEFGNGGVMTKDQLMSAIQSGNCSNCKIQMYNNKAIIRIKDVDKVDKVYNQVDAAKMLIILPEGTPLQVKIKEDDSWRQVIYGGIHEVQNRQAYEFIDGEGISGSFALSMNNVANNSSIKFRLNSNDPIRVSKILEKIKQNK